MQKNLKKIISFLQVVDSGSFTKAADILGLSRSMVSVDIKQLEAPKQKEKLNNGKVVAKNILETSKGEYKGTSIDLNDDKEYQSMWIISDGDGKSLTFKLKWGFIWHSEIWTKL